MSQFGSFKEEFEKIESQVTATREECENSFQKAKDSFDEILNLPKDAKLILYICDQWDDSEVVTFLKQNSIEFHGICMCYSKNGTHKSGFESISFAVLCSEHQDAFVLITTSYANSRLDSLLASGFPEERIISYPFGSATPPLCFIDDFTEFIPGYEYAYEKLIDDESRRVLLGMIRVAVLGEPMTVSSDSPQYLDRDLITLEHDEVFLDGGAYNGVSVFYFIKECNRNSVQYKKIYSFEPDQNALKLLRAGTSDVKNLEIIEKGLWIEDAILEFTIVDKGTSSAVINHEGIKVVLPVTSLDMFFKDKPVEDWPTFIKFDIEGAEVEALKGAKKIITTKLPKMTLCVYHKLDDVYELMKIALEYNPNYKFALRQHEDGYYEQVLYCF